MVSDCFGTVWDGPGFLVAVPKGLHKGGAIQRHGSVRSTAQSSPSRRFLLFQATKRAWLAWAHLGYSEENPWFSVVSQLCYTIPFVATLHMIRGNHFSPWKQRFAQRWHPQVNKMIQEKLLGLRILHHISWGCKPWHPLFPPWNSS